MMHQEQELVAPHAAEAEAALIGCAMTVPECLPEILEITKPSDFYSICNEIVFRTIVEIDEFGERPDKIALVTHLRAKGQLDRVGGLARLNTYLDVVASPASVIYWAKIVAEKAVIRRLIAAGVEIERIARDGEQNPSDAVLRANEALQAVESGDLSREWVEPIQRLSQALDRAKSHDKSEVVTTPWPSINTMLGGCYPGQLWVWAGAPKGGKSAAALTLADHIARHHGTVVYFAIEMGEFEISERQLAMYSGVSAKRQRARDLTGREKIALEKAAAQGASIQIEVVDRQCRSASAMRRMLRRISRNGRIKSVIVDHVGKMSEVISGNGKENKVERLDKTYNALIDIAAEFECTVHAIQLVNRNDQQAGNRPTLTGIRDGGNPEGHANAVILIHRPDPMNLDHQAHVGEFIVAAARSGDAGLVGMHFNGGLGLWTEATVPQHQPPQATYETTPAGTSLDEMTFTLSAPSPGTYATTRTFEP